MANHVVKEEPIDEQVLQNITVCGIIKQMNAIMLAERTKANPVSSETSRKSLRRIGTVAATTLALLLPNQLALTLETAGPDKDSVCNSENEHLSHDQAEGAALACERERKRARVALVAFDLNEQTAQTLARLTEETIQDATDGIDSPTIVPFTATGEMINEYRDRLSQNDGQPCVDTTDVDNYAAVIADKHMDIDDFSQVLAVVPDGICESKTVMGQALMSGSFRYTDVYKTDHTSDATAIQLSAQNAAHELGHLRQRFHHANGLQSPRYLEEVISSEVLKSEGVAIIDLNDWLSRSRYIEYNDSRSIMGLKTIYNDGGDGLHLDGMRYQDMSWTKRVLEGADDTEKSINNDVVILNDRSAEAYEYTSYTLSQPVAFQYEDFDGKPAVSPNYDKVYFERWASDNGINTQYLNAYLWSSASKDSLKLGLVNMYSYDSNTGQQNKPTELEFHIRDDIINVQSTDDGRVIFQKIASR